MTKTESGGYLRERSGGYLQQHEDIFRTFFARPHIEASHMDRIIIKQNQGSSLALKIVCQCQKVLNLG